MRRANYRLRKGLSLLELVIATTMMATLLASITVILRTGRQAWEAHEADFAQLEAGHAAVRHIVRRLRRATEVIAVTPPANSSGALSIKLSDETIHVWAHDNAQDALLYGEDEATELFATDVIGLTFTAYGVDGVTETTIPDEIHSIKIDLTVRLDRETNNERTITSWVWIRAW